MAGDTMANLYKTQVMNEMDLDRQNGVKDVVPDLAGNAKSEVEVLVVMSKMVLLHVPEIGGQTCVVHAKRVIRSSGRSI